MFGDPITNPKGWKIEKLGDVLSIKNGRNQKKVENIDGEYPIYGSGGIIGYANDYICNENSVIIGRKGNINKPLLAKTKFWNVDTSFGLEACNLKLNYMYLFFFCKFYNFERHNKAVTIPSLTKKDLLEILLPLPPLSLQNEYNFFIQQLDKSKFRIEKSLKYMYRIKEL